MNTVNCATNNDEDNDSYVDESENVGKDGRRTNSESQKN